MAQTKRKRKSKHRGNAAGVVEARGNTGKGGASGANGRQMTTAERRAARLDRPPSWSSAITRAGITAGLFALVLAFILKNPIGNVIALTGFMFVVYIPLGYWTDSFVYKRRMAKKAQGRG
ncbi:MAG: hypothetical protein V9E83_14825 [Baekduia sp.]